MRFFLKKLCDWLVNLFVVFFLTLILISTSQIHHFGLVVQIMFFLFSQYKFFMKSAPLSSLIFLEAMVSVPMILEHVARFCPAFLSFIRIH
jgi:hypothetical protein